MAIKFCSSLIITFLVIFSIVKGVNSDFDDNLTSTHRPLPRLTTTTNITISTTAAIGRHNTKNFMKHGRNGAILEFWDPVTKLNRRLGQRDKKYPPVKKEPLQPLSHHKISRSHDEVSIYNRGRYNPDKQNRNDSNHRELDPSINPLVKYENQRYDNHESQNDKDRYNRARYTKPTKTDDRNHLNRNQPIVPLLLNNKNHDEVKPLHKTEKERHHRNDKVNEVLENAMFRYSPKPTKPEIAADKECYDCTDADKHENDEDILTIIPFSKNGEVGYTGKPLLPINMDPKLRDRLKGFRNDSQSRVQKGHTFRAKHGKKTSRKSKKHSTIQSEPKSFRSGQEKKNMLRINNHMPVIYDYPIIYVAPGKSTRDLPASLQYEKHKTYSSFFYQNNGRPSNGYAPSAVVVKKLSTRMTPMYEMQAEEDREKSKESSNTNKKKETDPKKMGNAEYDDRFVLSTYAIEKQYRILLGEFSQAKVDSEILGRTASYNNILLLKITKKDDNYFRADDEAKYAKEGTAEKKIIFIVQALSCKGLNNLYSLTVETYLKKLLSFYLKHLDKFDIYLIPLGNPDGYSYLRNSNDMYWNKNRSPQTECPGVDLDRNFDVAWNISEGVSSCDYDYPGPTPFSEPESKAVRDVLHKYSYKIVAYIHVHAGTHDVSVFKGDAILYPKGYSDSTTDDDKYVDLRGEIDEAIKNANFKALTVTVDNLYNWYGMVTGTSVDYASSVYGIPYAMEMVMQVYQDPATVNMKRMASGVLEELEHHALKQVWSRVIDVVFNSIYKKVQMNDVEMRLI